MKLVPALFISANVLEIAAPAREWLKRQRAKIFCGNIRRATSVVFGGS